MIRFFIFFAVSILMLFSCTPKNTDGDQVLLDTTTAVSDTADIQTEVQRPEDLIVLETVYFEYNSWELSFTAREVMSKNARELLKYPSVDVILEGHCDERGTSEYNLALGQKRADACRSYLVNYGIAPERIRTVSYGKERPAATGTGESVWVKNRRVEFKTAS